MRAVNNRGGVFFEGAIGIMRPDLKRKVVFDPVSRLACFPRFVGWDVLIGSPDLVGGGTSR